MTDNNRRSQLEMRWVQVTDARGRTHLEAVWFTPAETASAAHAA